MTLTLLCRILGKSEATLLHNFNRTKENLAKKGIIIEKNGVGRTADYTLSYINTDEKEMIGE